MNSTIQSPASWQTLIFTDLDGSLLDHFDYQTAPAEPALRELEVLGYPVIFCTSKTFDETLQIRAQLNNHHPFIVENGAGIYVPVGYFPADTCQSFQASHHPDYLCVSLCEDRAHWLSILEEVKPRYQHAFSHFHEMGVNGIVRATGLSKEKAILANRRHHSEPILWQGNDFEKIRFIEEMRHLGANIEEGGRFLHLIGHCNKGDALSHLLAHYQQLQSDPISSIALGDGKNDVPMLSAADHAILIRSPVHPFPDVPKQSNLLKTDHYGPHGWAEGIHKYLTTSIKTNI